MQPRIFVTRSIPENGLELIRASCQVEIWPGPLPPPKEELLAKSAEVDGLLTMLTDPVDADVIAAGDRLRAISTYAVGFDNIDVSAATERGIPVGHTPGVLTETTADLAWSLLMCSARRIVEGAGYARAGHWKTWEPTLLLGNDVHRATLGLVGLGRIGQAMARRARGFSMRVIYYDPGVAESQVEEAEQVDLDYLLSESDFVSLHAPLTETTRNMIDAAALQKMKPTAALINTARGPIVDHGALLEALQKGRPAFAALDVTDPEPLPADHPLYELGRCTIVPHLGSASVATRSRMAAMAADNLLSGLRGQRMLHCANPEVYNR
ncbi:MAG: D-glycerate dehydrogenase [Polyangia bacterium]